MSNRHKKPKNQPKSIENHLKTTQNPLRELPLCVFCLFFFFCLNIYKKRWLSDQCVSRMLSKLYPVAVCFIPLRSISVRARASLSFKLDFDNHDNRYRAQTFTA